MGSFYRVQVRSARALQLVRLSKCGRPLPITFPFSVSLPRFLPPGSLPGQGSFPPGPTALSPQYLSPGPSPNPDTQTPQFWPGLGMRASCPCLCPLPSLRRGPPVRSTLSATGTGTLPAYLPGLLFTTPHLSRPVLGGASPRLRPLHSGILSSPADHTQVRRRHR